LILAINKVLAGEWNPEEQVESINSRYSWEKVTQDWIEFDKQLQGDK